MLKVFEQLKSEVEAAAEELRGRIVAQGWVASGTLLNSTRVESDERSIKLITQEWLDYLEFGREPSRRSEGGVVLERIKEWVKLRGIPDAAAYPIARKIHVQGWEPKADITTDLIQRLTDEVKKQAPGLARAIIVERIKRVTK
ncbi:MAG: hypothetical protein KatS3mg031_2844 [Chitinophagales bacterium]|nr:MAG: hypothetical protein KatS3mg031_2844 [Chitinophagales bacterium]